MLYPLAGLLLLIALLLQPDLDLRLPATPADLLGNPFHFWIITAAGLFSLTTGALMGEAATRRADARVLLLSLAVLGSAAAVLIHALATPNVLVQARNVGFVIAAPVGLVIAGFFCAYAARDLSPSEAHWITSAAPWLRSGLLVFWLLFALIALFQLPPFSLIPTPDQVDTPLFFCFIGQAALPVFQYPVSILLLGSTLAYGYATVRFARRYLAQPSSVLLALTVALAVLTFITLNIGLARTWHISWWQWHVMIVSAYALIAFAVFRQYRSEGSARPIFDSIYLDETVQRIRSEYDRALETLVADIQRRVDNPDAAPIAISTAVAQQFGLSEGQARVLEQAAEALAHERDQIERLGALVAVGQESSIIQEEQRLLQQALSLSSPAFRHDQFRIGLIQAGKLDFSADLRGGPQLPPLSNEQQLHLFGQALRERTPVEVDNTLILPLTVKGRAAGLLEIRRERGRFADRDRWLLRTLASQLSVALENVRLYRQIDVLFRQYMPASVATALLADPNQAALGGAVREISVMFGDLRGFTSLSERLSPSELVRLLNRYYGAATQAVLAEGGTIDKFMGDAMMALFNAPVTQGDHALRACRAALAMQAVIAPIAAESADMPRFGIGITTGSALVGNIGAEEIRNFTAIGDTVNLASRLQTRAEGGQILISGATYALVRDYVLVRPLGQIQVKGKEAAVDAFILLGMR